MVEGIARLFFQAHELGYNLIHMLCAQAAESGEHHRLVSQAQLLPGTGLVVVQKALLHRHTYNLHPFGMAVVFDALFKCHQHPAGPVGNHLCGNTGHGVGLVDAGGDAHFASGIEGREAGIAAGTNNHIRLELPKNLLAGGNSLQHAVDGVDILLQARQRLFAAQAGARQSPQLIARLRHQLFLHMAYGTDEQDLAVRVPLPHFVGNGDGGVNMSGGTAASKNKIQFAAS